MLTFDTHQLSLLVSQFFWPLIRVLALLATAPIFRQKYISAKVKVGLGVMITFLIMPSLPGVAVPLFSVAGLWLAIAQILIGSAIGLTMQCAFAAIRLVGDIIGLQMGLSFAIFFDPSGGPNMPVLARLLNLLAMLTFLAFDGHLWLISMLADSFHTLPITVSPLNSAGFFVLAQTGSLIFMNGMALALPLITLLLTLNLVLGMLGRMTPQLSIFVVGFPLTLSVGMLVVGLLIPMLVPLFEYVFAEMFDRLAEILRAMVY